MSPEYEPTPDADPQETSEWLESFDSVLQADGPERAKFLLRKLVNHARRKRAGLPALTQTGYFNTIGPEDEPPFPGDEQMERRIRRLIRWNAMAMVTRANNRYPGLGGHLSTYASSASLYEIGFNHFFRGKDADGHGRPGLLPGPRCRRACMPAPSSKGRLT